MGTELTLTTVKKRMVAAFTTALATASDSGGQIPVDYAWPGPATDPEHVFLGRHPALGEIRSDVDMTIPNMKAGRKQLQEFTSFQYTVWVFRPDLSSDGAEACEVAAETIHQYLIDVLQDDTTIGLPSATTIQWAQTSNATSELHPREQGWACERVVTVTVEARIR